MAISAKFQQREQPQRQQSSGEINQGEAAGDCHTLLCFLCFLETDPKQISGVQPPRSQTIATPLRPSDVSTSGPNNTRQGKFTGSKSHREISTESSFSAMQPEPPCSGIIFLAAVP